MSNTMYYKILGLSNQSINGGNYEWTPGEWSPRIENLYACRRGYHLTREETIYSWLPKKLHGYLWETEVDTSVTPIEHGSNKTVFCSVKLTRVVGRFSPRAYRLTAIDIMLNKVRQEGKKRRCRISHVLREINRLRSNVSCLSRACSGSKQYEDEFRDFVKDRSNLPKSLRLILLKEMESVSGIGERFWTNSRVHRMMTDNKDGYRALMKNLMEELYRD